MDDNWEIYCSKARAILAEAGLYETIEISKSRKGMIGNNTFHVYIEPFPVKGNKRKIDLLNKIKCFNGVKFLKGERYIQTWLFGDSMSDLARIIERAKVIQRYGISLNIMSEEIPMVLEALENQLHNSSQDPIADALQKILDKENNKISGR